ncbi:radical SAM protein [Pseudomonadota bacterium]
MKQNYQEKFERLSPHTLLGRLDSTQQLQLRKIAFRYGFTLQELKKAANASIDLEMWGEPKLIDCWWNWEAESKLKGREFKKYAFTRLDQLLQEFKQQPTRYQNKPLLPLAYRRSKVEVGRSREQDKIFGMCPVQSQKTVCCNLRTIDAVKNCGFGCTYCSIQTMFTKEEVQFDVNFAEKLDQIELDQNRRYHIGTGQSSDALMWGNSHGVLDHMFTFARKWPNALIEFKTKSKKIKYFIEKQVPFNIVCSWSVNPEQVVNNEEHLTSSLEERLQAARKVADRGVKVAFHLHPMIYYQGFREDYICMIYEITRRFSPDEVLFVSFGTLTYPKPIIEKIRSHKIQSKILQMDMVPNPEGKMTYPDHIKEQLFELGYRAFQPWHGEVFFYLCMEEPKFWRKTFGSVYASNEDFEQDFYGKVWPKLGSDLADISQANADRSC